MGTWFANIFESVIRRVDKLLRVVQESETKGTTVSANFRGIKQLGENPTDGVVATWSWHSIAGIGTPGAPDAGPMTPTLPDQFGYHANFDQSYKWILDTKQVQGSYTFGTIKKLRVQINKLRSWVSGDSKWYLSGRIWIYIPLTNELFCVADSQPLAFDTIATVEDNPESYNEEFHINAPAGSTIEVWCESDFLTGNLIASPTMCVVVNAYNRD